MTGLLKTNNNILGLAAQSPLHTKRIELKIKELQTLEPGWDFGEGEAVSQEVGESSLSIAEFGLLLGLNANVRPTTEGGIIVSLFKNDQFLFITVNPDELFDVVYEKGIGINYDILDSKENLDSKSIKDYISQWVLSEHYTSESMTKMQNVLPVMHLGNIRMGEFQYLMNNVQGRQVITYYADTLNVFTKSQSETPFAFAG
jgi:hypothetical protein